MILAVDIDEDLLKSFRRWAVEKHGRLYNSLKPEVELALRNHLARNERGEPSGGGEST